MPSFKYDDTPRKAYEEPGEYLVTVESAEWKVSPQGNTMIKVTLRTEGGALVFDNLVFSEKSFWKPSQAFACFFPSKGKKLPAKGEEFQYDERQDWLDEYLLGGRGYVLLSQGKTTTGKTRNEVDSYLPPKAGKPVPTATTPSAPATSAPATKPAPAKFPKAEPDDDEIPF